MVLVAGRRKVKELREERGKTGSVREMAWVPLMLTASARGLWLSVR
jgi:hypothetical protein